VDLRAQHREVESEITRGFARVIEESSFILGGEVGRFEESFARHCGVPHCVGVANGTDALELILRASGVGPEDEVVLPANTFIATALAVARAGARPVLVDCDERHQLMDVASAADRVTKRTRAVIVVDLFGQVGPFEEASRLAEAHGCLVFEDAAQAQGARQHGKAAGSFGLAAGTSFYPGKNLGAYGDAGAVLTGSDEIARRVRALRNYGSDVRYHHPETGFNSRLDSLQAVVLNAKLARLEEWNVARGRAADRYRELLADLPGVSLPEAAPGNDHVWHLYVVQVSGRDEVLRRIQAAGIGAGVHYPVPIHLQGAFRHLGHGRGAFPVTEEAAARNLSLPLFPHITQEQQERVARELRRALP
jgi:dTDP-4-amino-4,6-dideoxygalactose transaminase